MNRVLMSGLVLALGLLAGCGGGGGDAAPVTATPAPAPVAALARVEPLAAGSACAQGGRAVALGLDSNGNGQLDDGEVTARTELCSGRAGAAGRAALTRTEAVPRGGACAEGGVRVLAGLDADGDGTLATAEATHTTVLCHADAGRAAAAPLLAIAGEAPGPACALGGTRISRGADLDGDGLLSDAEVTQTQTLCRGSAGATGTAARPPLLAVATEPPGSACAMGGQRLASGVDADGNGVLDGAEVAATALVCQGAAGAAGAPGANGAPALLALSSEPAGSRCATGGMRLDAGVDRNGNGTLDSAEIASTRYLCEAAAGAAGAPAALPLLALRAEPPGSACAAGGQRLDAGPDRNGNGQLDAEEVGSSAYVCDGAAGSAGSDGQNALVRVNAAGTACTGGGQAVASGLDANRNGVLDDAEVASVELVCNGTAGTAGGSGAAGANGLVVSSALAPGVPCATGGQSLRRGLDNNGNGVLDAAEVTATSVACNGSDSAGFVWTARAGSALDAAANQGFVTTRADGEATVTLPASPVPGAFYRVSGLGAGGWVLAQREGQHIALGAADGVVRREGLFTSWLDRGPVQAWQALAGSADLGLLVGGVRNGQLQVSNDQGVSWAPRGIVAAWQGVALSADGRRLAAVAAGGRVHTSINGGQIWTARENLRDWSAIASSADGLRLVATVRNGQIHTSSDGGVTWTARDSARAWSAVASARDGLHLLATEDGGRLYTSADGGVSWTARDSARAWTAVASSASGERLLAADRGGVLRLSSDAGLSWQTVGPTRGWLAVAMSADGGRLLATADDGSIVGSDDGGASWTARGTAGAATALAMSADGADAMQAVDGGVVRFSAGARGTLTTGVGPGGALRGGQGSAAQLQYLGDGVFLLRSRQGTLFAD